MRDFLAENNLCGQNILQLVSRGNAVIAEILRLKDYIPKVYRLENKQETQKYADIILDFSYFQIAEGHENKIESNDVLQDLDSEFRDNHIQIIERFYLAFKSIHTYVCDLNHYIEELNDGIYLHQTLETVFADMEGRQLLCEALFLYGTMLLMVDAHIEGIIRERLLVSYYRYTPQKGDSQSGIDEVCKLLRDTGYTTTKKPNNYPEDYFKRIPINLSYIDIVIGRLRSDDIYNQLTIYQRTKHRSTALAAQASMLYICLYFSTDILHNQPAIMREIVDKYFPDSWVLSIYMGYTVNIIETWEPFKAARVALNNTLESSNIKNLAAFYSNKAIELYNDTVKLLQEGTITHDNLLSIISNIITVLKDCNVVLRWLILQTANGRHDNNTVKHKRIKQIRDLVISECKCDNSQIFRLLLNTAQLELITRDTFKSLLADREKKWDELKKESYNSLNELADVFGGTKPLSRIEKNMNLHKWFLEISNQVNMLTQTDSASSRKIIQLIQALEEVQEYHQLESNMQIVQYLGETRKHLNQMIRTMNIKEDVLITMQVIGDVSYAWELIDSFTEIMQFGIQRDPNLVIKLRAVFLKLASALEIPLLRINQAHSEDFDSVTQYYSSELEVYVRKVLQIIPNMMFEKLNRIIEMQTNVLKELPTKLDKDKLKEYAQLNERFEYAKLTHSISVFSMGMRMMKSTLVGVICLDPKDLLEDGIRKELVQHISRALNNQLIFSTKFKHEDFSQKLKNLSCIMDGYKRSFEYIQDYININGLKIWQEEVTRIINYNVEQECNGFLRNKVHDWESAYQSRHVPIPYYPPTDNISENFIGRLAREMIKLTDLKNTSYIEQTATWYDAKTHRIVLNRSVVTLMASAIEVTGFKLRHENFARFVFHITRLTLAKNNRNTSK
ncbi:Hereditary spastic paraplegia protein strumpellin [Popillia japonica]|uniref:Hereditary spastic paraplegia protein strumpellin n=1 Tax=Popillia japonica TaxID=7064 RepID=A0AAW1N0Z6_POPJA